VCDGRRIIPSVKESISGKNARDPLMSMDVLELLHLYPRLSLVFKREVNGGV